MGLHSILKDNMADFRTWEQHNLAKFAKEANAKILEQQEEIDRLRDDLRAAIQAYRQLIKEQNK
jgi:hypothetical protein